MPPKPSSSHIPDGHSIPSKTTSNELVKTTRVILISLHVPVVPFLLIGELPGDRWFSAQDGRARTIGRDHVPQ